MNWKNISIIFIRDALDRLGNNVKRFVKIFFELSERRRRCSSFSFELIYSRLLKSIKGLPLKNRFVLILAILVSEEWSFRKEGMGGDYLLPSIIFHFYLFIIQRLHPSCIGTFKGINGGSGVTPRWVKINALPSKFYEVEKRDATSFVTLVSPFLLHAPLFPSFFFFFFRKKSTTIEEEIIRSFF